MNNPQQTIISQYASSPRLVGLLTDWSTDLDATPNFIQFYAGIWNVLEASGYGLDVWGRIVGAQRSLRTDILPASFFGFAETPFDALGFAETGQSGSFYSGQAIVQPTTLADEPFRTLILVKALANFSNASAASTNAILASVFGDRGACYAVEDAPMHFQLVFHFPLSPTDFAVLTETGIQLRPCGVSYSIVEAP